MSEQVQLMEWDDEARILLRTEIESYRQRVLCLLTFDFTYGS